MEETSVLPAPGSEQYTCPGETHPIDRAVHLARLAGFYPACRRCAHRGDVQLLTDFERRAWAELERRGLPHSVWRDEGFDPGQATEIEPALVRRLARAIAYRLWQDHRGAAESPAVVIGFDGHWTTAESLTVACETLRLDGLKAIEAGATTGPALATLAHKASAHASMWIGRSAAGSPLLMRFGGAGGRPWSRGGELDSLASLFEAGELGRARRAGGRAARLCADNEYIEPLGSLYHALRPLQFVLDTSSGPLIHFWRRLAADSACVALSPRAEASSLDPSPRPTWDPQRLSRSVMGGKADFGIWIDGDGEACALLDEAGLPIEHGQLAAALVGYIRQQNPAAVIVDVGQPAGSAAGTREAMCDQMLVAKANFGIGAKGQFWYGGEPPVCDALVTLTLVLKLLSQSDRPISRVLDVA
jgi:phosphomannomutase